VFARRTKTDIKPMSKTNVGANYDGNYPLEGCSKGEFRDKTTPVGSFDANNYGLYDMHGNIQSPTTDNNFMKSDYFILIILLTKITKNFI